MGTRHWPEDADEAVEELQGLITENRKLVNDLIKERDELKADNEILRSFVGELWSDHSQANRAKFIYKQTTKQSLNEIKAQAIEEMKNKAISTQEKTNKALIDFGEGSRVRKLKAIDLPWINDYIKKLREQSK